MHMHRGFSITGKKKESLVLVWVSSNQLAKAKNRIQNSPPTANEKKCFFAFLKENQRAVQFSERLLVSGNFSLLDFLIGNMS